jgi:hypothetical protein
MKKGQGFGSERFFELGSIVFISALFLIFGAILLMNVGGAKDQLCKIGGKYLGGFCPETAEKEYANTAEESVKALVCAVNSVATGEIWMGDDCSKYYAAEQQQAGLLPPVLAQDDKTDVKVHCNIKNRYTCGYIAGGRCFWDFTSVQSAFNEEEAVDKCQDDFDKRKLNVFASSLCIKKEETEKNAVCAVTDFQLPQDFETAKAEEWIAGFGDPEFLVYWQQFPRGEDEAWSGSDPWFQGIGTVMFISMCVGHFVSPVVKTLKVLRGTRITKLGSAMKMLGQAEKTRLQTKIGELKDTIRAIGKKIGKAREVEQRVTALDTNGAWITTSLKSRKSYIAALKDVLKGESTEWFKKNWKPAMDTALKKAGLIGAASLAAARIDYNIGKLVDEYPNQIVLQQTLRKRQSYTLQNLGIEPHEDMPLETRKPVILAKAGWSVANPPASFYLASPCAGDVNVEQTWVTCDGYFFDSATNMVTCLPKGFSSEPKTQLCGSMKLAPVSDDMQMFKDNNGDSKWDEFTFKSDWEDGEKYDSFDVEMSADYRAVSVTLKDTDFNGKWDEFVFKGKKRVGYEEKTITARDQNEDGRFELADEDGDGRFEILYKNIDSYEEENWPGRADKYKDEDGDGEYETLISEKTRYFRIINWITPGASYGLEVDPDAVYSTKMFNLIDTNGNGDLDWFRTSRIPSIIYMDINHDGYIDMVLPGMKYYDNGDWQCKKEGICDMFLGSCCKDGSRVSVSPDGNGYTIETRGSCSIPGIKISVEKRKGEEHNYCYSKEPWYGTAIMIGSIGIDALAKKVPNPIAWIVGTAADCGLAYLHTKVVKKPWPQ